MRNKRKKNSVYQAAGTETGTVTFTVSFDISDPTTLESKVGKMLEKKAKRKKAAQWLYDAALKKAQSEGMTEHEKMDEDFAPQVYNPNPALPKSEGTAGKAANSMGLKFGKNK